MSLLMDALKQQQQVQLTESVRRDAVWPRYTLLALLVSAGMGMGFWLGQPRESVVVLPTPLPSKESEATFRAQMEPHGFEDEQDKGVPLSASAVEIAQELFIAAEMQASELRSGLHEQNGQLVLAATQKSTKGTHFSQDERFEPLALAEASEAQTLEPLERLLSSQELEPTEVPDALRQKFESALAQSQGAKKEPRITYHDRPALPVEQLDDYVKRQLPALNFEAHVYASEPSKRWIKVNGKELQQGQWLSADVRVKEILPQYVVLQYEQLTFSVDALRDWRYLEY